MKEPALIDVLRLIGLLWNQAVALMPQRISSADVDVNRAPMTHHPDDSSVADAGIVSKLPIVGAVFPYPPPATF